MKKKLLIPLISLAAIGAGISANFISANIGDKTGYRFLNGLKDFDWTDVNYGDGEEYLNNAQAQDEISSIMNNTKEKNVGSVNKGRFLDYSKFSTGFQNSDGIRKQAVTGVPLNVGYMPNGNYVSDFGITSKAQKYSTVNSILDWDTNKDMDAKYDRSYVPLQNSTKTAFIYKNKDTRMNFDYLGFSSRKHRTFDNTVVGTKNPFEGTNLNWQYTSNFINWSGSWFEGPIVPPPGDTIDIAHKNGTPIYGNIFLDGSHGLTKQMLRDFVKTDSNGNYLVVDFLLKLASYNGFDGYFLNDESNGFDPNGTVLDYNKLIEIVRQFNEKSSQEHLNKKIIFYRAWATLSKLNNEYVDKETYGMTQTMPNKEPMDIQLDFSEPPAKSQEFLKENPSYNANNLYSIYNLSNPGGGYMYAYGSYDWKELGYGEPDVSYEKNGDRKIDYKDKDKVYSSISGYMDDGSAAFGTTALDYINKNYKNSDAKTMNRKFVFANEVSNLYNDILFNGTNINPADTDQGLLNGKYRDYANIKTSSQNVMSDFIMDDPRINIAGKKAPNDAANAAIKNLVYNYDNENNNGINKNSYGVGNLIQEKTVFEDENNSSLALKTDFSTGSGIKFVDRNSDNKALTTENYPFTNKRLADVLPTYQWDINVLDKNESIGDIDNMKTSKPKITNLNGFYDYDIAYKKTNSIAIGKDFNEKGEIENGKWDTKKKYIWNIMGTNLSNSNHDHVFTFTYKDDDKAEIKPVITLTNQKTKKSQYVQIDNFKDLGETEDGWKTIKFSLGENHVNIDQNNKVSRIGLIVTPQSDDFKLNVGEFSMDFNATEVAPQRMQSNLYDFVNEYKIERGNLINLRFNYKNKLYSPNFDYIEFYIKDKTNKWFRVGETTADEYFIKDVDKTKFGDVIDLDAITYKDNEIVGSDRYEID